MPVVLGFPLADNFNDVMQLKNFYDVAIIGGGLAGLSCAISLGREGHSVILFEKEKFPFHKVCGEYLGEESWNYLRQLGVSLEEMRLPLIDTLLLTAPGGQSFTTPLHARGMGISRYALDSRLAQLARETGVELVEETKADEVISGENYEVRFSSRATDQKSISARVCCAAYGKRSNLDVKWKRGFLDQQDKRLFNYVGIKYHVEGTGKENVIQLHNFENGYCGLSKIEKDKYCLCYMTRAEDLKLCENNISLLEHTILMKNPHLAKIFSQSRFLPGFPLTISQINFQEKKQVENGILMLGDAAGLLTPLCGNGMSIALHTGKLASEVIHPFLSGDITRAKMEAGYAHQWTSLFSRRLQTGRTLQRFFGNIRLSNAFVAGFRAFPFLAGPVQRMTHGKSF
ncbi:MAG: NAD(P)/FAD-dependent oxidoreductase [Flavisolibacter sp.]